MELPCTAVRRKRSRSASPLPSAPSPSEPSELCPPTQSSSPPASFSTTAPAQDSLPSDSSSSSSSSSPDSDFDLGLCYEQGAAGVEQDLSTAFKYYQRAADRGHAAAQVEVGWWYQTGTGGVPQNASLSAKYYQLAADQGDPVAMFFLAECYRNGVGVEQSDYLASVYRSDARRKGEFSDLLSCMIWYSLHKFLKSGAAAGEVATQMQLGTLYAVGAPAVERDFSLALKYYRLAADQGHVPAQIETALCFLRGRGVEKNEAMGLQYLRLSAEQGNSVAQVYYYKYCSDWSDPMKMEYLRRAARQGDYRGREHLAQCYLQGHGVERNPLLAAIYMQLVAAGTDEFETSSLMLAEVGLDDEEDD